MIQGIQYGVFSLTGGSRDKEHATSAEDVVLAGLAIHQTPLLNFY